MELPQPFDKTVRIKCGNKNWKIVALRKYESTGYCEAGGWLIAEGFKTREEAKEAAENEGLIVLS